MIPNDLHERQRMIQRMLDICHGNSDQLTKWEKDFIDSAHGQFAFKENLSDRQCEILEKIYDKL